MDGSGPRRNTTNETCRLYSTHVRTAHGSPDPYQPRFVSRPNGLLERAAAQPHSRVQLLLQVIGRRPLEAAASRAGCTVKLMLHPAPLAGISREEGWRPRSARHRAATYHIQPARSANGRACDRLHCRRESEKREYLVEQGPLLGGQ